MISKITARPLIWAFVPDKLLDYIECETENIGKDNPVNCIYQDQGYQTYDPLTRSVRPA